MALSNGQVQEIQRILSERQLEAHRRYLEKREEIFRKLPELEELEEKVRAFSLSVAGEMQQGNRTQDAAALVFALQTMKYRYAWINDFVEKVYIS